MSHNLVVNIPNILQYIIINVLLGNTYDEGHAHGIGVQSRTTKYVTCLGNVVNFIMNERVRSINTGIISAVI